MIIGFDVKRFDNEKKLIPCSAAVAPLRIHVKLHDTEWKVYLLQFHEIFS